MIVILYRSINLTNICQRVMEAIDEERLILILQTTADIVLGKKTEESLNLTLLDIDEHVRTRLISNLVTIFRKGMAYRLDLDSFDKEIEKMFSNAKLISKALHQYWKKTQANLQQQYEQLCPFDNRLTGLKWVSVLPSDSKFGMEKVTPIVQCRFNGTNDSFNICFTQTGINDLSDELAKINTTLQNFK